MSKSHAYICCIVSSYDLIFLSFDLGMKNNIGSHLSEFSTQGLAASHRCLSQIYKATWLQQTGNVVNTPHMEGLRSEHSFLTQIKYKWPFFR